MQMAQVSLGRVRVCVSICCWSDKRPGHAWQRALLQAALQVFVMALCASLVVKIAACHGRKRKLVKLVPLMREEANDDSDFIE
jgi:hypothetical protein